MRTEKVTPLCDFCAVEAPTVEFLVPKGTITSSLRNEATGQVEVTESMDGRLGSCEACAEIVRSPGSVRITRLARRVFEINPAFKTCSSAHVSYAKKIMRKLWRRWIAAIQGEQPHVPGESPTDGLRVFVTKGEENLN